MGQPRHIKSDMTERRTSVASRLWDAAPYIMLVGMLISIAYAACEAYDNDMWFLVSTGREICTDGFPRTNPWFAVPGMGVVIQQWLVCVVEYLTYSMGGMPAMRVLTYVCAVAAVVFLWRAATDAGGRTWRAAFVVSLTFTLGYWGLCAYISIRPHTLAMCSLAVTVSVCERYMRRHDPNDLWPLPIVAWFMAQSESALLALPIGMVVLYAVPAPKGLAAHIDHASAPRLPLLAAAALMCAMALVNPYGWHAVAYAPLSFGAANYGGFINEMKPLAWDSQTGVSCLLAMACAAVLFVRRVRLDRRINMPLALFFAASIVGACLHTRNVWICVCASAMLAAASVSGLRRPGRRRLAIVSHGLRQALPLAAAAVAVMAVLVWREGALPSADYQSVSDGHDTPVAAMDWLDEHGLSDCTVMANMNPGGYLEWRGHRVTVDPRPELYSPALSGGIDTFRREVDAQNDRSGNIWRELLTEYHPEAVVSDAGMSLAWAAKGMGYKVATTGNGYVLLIRPNAA